MDLLCQDCGSYIAGGLPAWMAGFTTTYSDIDYFFTDSEALASMIKADYGNDRTGLEIMAGPHVVSLKRWRSYVDVEDREEPTHQLILHLYKAPTEIVHGF